MWDWVWPIAGGLVVLAWLAPLLGRSDDIDNAERDQDDTDPEDLDGESPMASGPVTWMPHHFPMGPISRWPNDVDPPDSIPLYSPMDRPDL